LFESATCLRVIGHACDREHVRIRQGQSGLEAQQERAAVDPSWCATDGRIETYADAIR